MTNYSREPDPDALPNLPQAPVLHGYGELTKQDLKEIRASDFKFRDRRDYKAKLDEEESEAYRQRPKVVRMAKAKLSVNRVDPDVVAGLEGNAVEYIKQELIRALAAEIFINRELYADEVVDSVAISNSNKRLIELSDSLKSLPKQNEGGKHRDQKSAAEIIEDTLKSGAPAPDPESENILQNMMAKASTAFEEE